MLLNQEKSHLWKLVTCSFNLLVFCCLAWEIRLFGQDLPYPEACWPYSSVAWSLLSSLLTKKALATGNSICSSPLSQQRGFWASASKHLSSVPFARAKADAWSELHCELWHGKKMDVFQKQKIIAEDKSPCYFSKGYLCAYPHWRTQKCY